MGMLERLKGLKEKALEGKWSVDPMHIGVWLDNSKMFDVRGWGKLTGKGVAGLGLSDEEAMDIQKANAELVAESLNALPHLLKEIEVLKEGLKFSRTCLDECQNFIISRTDDEFCSGAINAKNGKDNAEKALAEAERIEKG